MKEFIFGGLIALWIASLGLSTVDTFFTYSSILLPVFVAGIVYNMYLFKQIKNRIK